ncbi:hypothetical protein IFM89_024643 [Coptis chinensis]|uniref:Dihydropyrimidinase n=1 Tax=Coptis chinensis TaxID=261450 RepID=A0A835H564_9MAGN|nr:hypothetical protein IFM89_024643 [Coptis chinensis]
MKLGKRSPMSIESLNIFYFYRQTFSESNQQIPEVCDVYGDFECGASSSSKLLIKGGTVVNAHRQELADVYVENGIIVTVTLYNLTSSCNLQVGDDVTILDATGKYVMPGGIDLHTHLGMEFMGTETIDDFFSGQAAALAGGTTMHIDFVIPVNGSLSAGFKAYTKKAQTSCMDYGFHMAITKWDEVVASDMEIMVREKGQRVVGEPVVSGQVLDDSWPWDNDFTTAANSKARTRIPFSSFLFLNQYLMHCQVTRVFHCSRYVISPPISKLGHGKALQAALTTGTLQLVGTDHCTFNSTQNALGIDDFRKIPNGVNGNIQFLSPKE